MKSHRSAQLRLLLQRLTSGFLLLAVMATVASASATDPAPGKRGSIPDLVAQASPAVVFIGNVGANGEVQSIGSGFVVKPEGVVVTNFHVIEGAKALQVKMLDGEIYDRIEVIDYDVRRDLAVLKIPAFKTLPTVPLGDASQVLVGQEAVAIGNPQGFEHTVTTGVVSAFRRTEGYRLMQISVPISPGSSGGPLFDLDGKVIGITTSQWVGERSQNLNFAVPAEYVRPLLETKSDPISVAELPQRQPEAPPQQAVQTSGPAGEEPLAAWGVAHDHGSNFDEFCIGYLYISRDVIGFTTEAGAHAWEVPLSGVEEVKKNSLYGSEYGAFHVKLITGTNYNFVAVNDELQYMSPDAILITIIQVLEQQ